jgi:hypothetical protein
MVVAELPREMEEAYLYPIGDLHLGDPACDLDKLYRYLKVIGEADNRYILLNGDLANVATKSSKSDTYREEFPTGEQVKRLVAIFEPFRDRILAMTGGNHEARISRETGIDINETVAIMLGIPGRYRFGEVYLKVSVGEYREKGKPQKPVVYTLYMTHGSRGGRKAGGTANQLEDFGLITDADIYVSGHTHKKMVFPLGFHRIDARSGTVRAMKHLCVSTGAYLKREGYAIECAFTPTWPGSVRIRLDGRRHDAHASV